MGNNEFTFAHLLPFLYNVVEIYPRGEPARIEELLAFIALAQGA
jgi:hypothetical protein